MLARELRLALIQEGFVTSSLGGGGAPSPSAKNPMELHIENMHLMREKTKSRIREASKAADLVLLQELHTTQYFCQSEDDMHFDFAYSFEDNVRFFSSAAKECGVVLVSSLFEKRADGLYHNTAVVSEKDGSIAGKYRKMHIPDDPQFYEKFYFAPGDLGFTPIKTSVGTLGVLICWDQWFPEAARIMALRGAEILIYPTAIGWFDSDSEDERARQLDAWRTVQRGHAIANGIHLASINRVGFEIDSSCSRVSSNAGFSPHDNGVLVDGAPPHLSPRGIRFFGNSFVCGPQGEILAEASNEKEEILYATLDLDRTRIVRQAWPFLRDRRVDSYGEILKLYGD